MIDEWEDKELLKTVHTHRDIILITGDINAWIFLIAGNKLKIVSSAWNKL